MVNRYSNVIQYAVGMFGVNNGCFYKDCNKTFDENVFKE